MNPTELENTIIPGSDSGLSRKTIIAQLGRLNTTWSLAVLAQDWTIILLCFVFIRMAYLHGGIEGVAICWILGVIIGSRQHALLFLTHETTHRLICRNRVVNDIIGCVFCSFPTFILLDAYRPFHFEHHRQLGTADDPELGFYELFDQWKMPSSWPQLCAESARDLFGLNFYYPALFAYKTRPTNLVSWCCFTSYWIAVLLILHLTQSWWILAVWIWCFSTSFWWVQRVNTWTEHMGTMGTHRFSATFWQKFLFYPHNSWCHWEHHEYPQIPFFNLPKVRDLTIDASEISSMERIFTEYLMKDISGAAAVGLKP